VRVALSGTPVENRLKELHSIMDFAVPGYLPEASQFEKEFARILERKAVAEPQHEQRRVVRDRLLNAIQPFMLRRCKTDPEIAPDLPQKIEVNHDVELTIAQRALYNAIVSTSMQEMERYQLPGDVPLPEAIIESVDVDDIDQENDLSPTEAVDEQINNGTRRGEHSRRVMAIMHGLQQVCNHPVAVGDARWPVTVDRSVPEFGLARENSGKTDRLLALLEECLEPPVDKVIIFTQYLRTLELLRFMVQAAHPSIEVLALHGALPRTERDGMVKRFQENTRSAVLICTLGTGGVGLNLTAATHVVHFDRCWNPAKEAQATDRAHRIGQHSTVIVHRLVTKDTFEERIAKVLDRKIALARDCIPLGGLISELGAYSIDDLRELLSLNDTHAG